MLKGLTLTVVYVCSQCAAYLKSMYFRALISEDDDWENLHAIICRFHDLKCHTDWLVDNGLSMDAEKLDRASKCFRCARGARAARGARD